MANISNNVGLDASSLEHLKCFLDSPDRPEETFKLNELMGFLFAVASSPEVISPSEWLPQVFAEADAGYQNGEEEASIVAHMTALLDQIDQGVINKSVGLPAFCQPASSLMDNFKDDAALHQWSHGFMTGHTWLETLWDDLPEEIDEEVGTCMIVLSFFANRELADSYHKDFGEKGESFEQMAQSIVDSFEDAMVSYADIGMILRTGE